MAGAVVLLSGGLDSSYNLFQAKEEFKDILALTFDYGQRAAKKEIESAKFLANQIGCKHRIVDLKFFSEFTKTALVNPSAQIPTEDVKIDDEKRSQETASAVWVPNRNGIFLNVASGFAEGLGYSTVIPGFNLEEAATFPDNSKEFCQALDRSFSYSTENGVTVKCYSIGMTKEEIYKNSKVLQVPFEKLWPCYLDHDNWCGQCESCRRFFRAKALGEK